MQDHSLEYRLVELWPLEKWRATRQLLAVSGGADSVALLRAMVSVAPRRDLVEVAHFNHGWRGAASDADEQFVRELCQAHRVRLWVGRASKGLTESRNEAQARQQRYAFLCETAYAVGARYVLTAHTADDRVETLLHNLFRGTGLAGVAACGVLRSLDRELVLVRPLLNCTRTDIERYLTELAQVYRMDASNLDTRYRRNYLRHELLPRIRQQYGPGVDQRLLSFSQLVEETLGTLQALADDYLAHATQLWRATRPPNSIGNAAGDPIVLPTAALLPAAWPVVREAIQGLWQQRGWSLQAMSRSHWEQIRGAIEGDCAPVTLPGNLQLTADTNWVCIAGAGSAAAPPAAANANRL